MLGYSVPIALTRGGKCFKIDKVYNIHFKNCSVINTPNLLHAHTRKYEYMGNVILILQQKSSYHTLLVYLYSFPMYTQSLLIKICY